MHQIYINFKKKFETIEQDSFTGANDTYTVFKQQTTFQMDFETLKDSDLFEVIVNRDFPGRSPRWILDDKTNQWDVYIVSDKVIYNPFDDRGACIMFRDDADYQKFVMERTR